MTSDLSAILLHAGLRDLAARRRRQDLAFSDLLILRGAGRDHSAADLMPGSAAS